MHTSSMAARLPLEVNASGSVVLTAYCEVEDAMTAYVDRGITPPLTDQEQSAIAEYLKSM